MILTSSEIHELVNKNAISNQQLLSNPNGNSLYQIPGAKTQKGRQDYLVQQI